MPNVSFGGSSSGGSFTGGSPIYSDGISLPTGREMTNGSKQCLITHLLGYVSGYGASRTVRLDLGSTDTASFTVAAASDSQSTGYRSCSHWLVQGGKTRFSIYTNGLVRFGKGGSGHTYDGGPGWPGTLGGAYTYAQAPSAPRNLSVTPSEDGQSAQVNFSAPSDNGGMGVTGYKLQRALNSSFTSGLATIDSDGSTLVTGLTPNTRYYWRATARNAVTSAAGATGGPWSSTVNALQPSATLGGIRSSDNSSWLRTEGRIRSADNSAWPKADGRIRSADNSSWLPLGLIP